MSKEVVRNGDEVAWPRFFRWYSSGGAPQLLYIVLEMVKMKNGSEAGLVFEDV